MNILFIGAGKRVSMVEIFTAAGFNIFSYETELNVPISKYATIILGKTWKDIDILKDISNTIQKNNIKLVIPFQDAAIEICSLIKNTNVLSSNLNTAKICHNKKLLESFMVDNFLNYYPIPDNNSGNIYKPIYGFGGKGIIKSNTKLNLNMNEYVHQKEIDGVEYSVDCYSDKNGVFVDGVSRIRMETCCGEVVKSKTILNTNLTKICEEISNKLNIIGPSNFQFIIDKNNKPYLIEINCRFGGGSTFSYKVGFDFINLIKFDYFNEIKTYTKNSWKKNVMLSRYYGDYIYEE